MAAGERPCELRIGTDAITRDDETAVRTPELWDFYARLVAKLEGERPQVLAAIEALRVPVEESHREEWERRARLAEVEDLKKQVQAAEWRLLERQESVLHHATENDGLRAQAPSWEADLDQVRASVQPRIESVHFRPGVLPERIGSFASCTTSAMPVCGGAGTAGGRGPSAGPHVAPRYAGRGGGPGGCPIHVQYLPGDREKGVERHLEAMKDLLEREREGRAASSKTFQELQRVEEEEGRLLTEALQDAIARAQSCREQMQGQADVVTRWHLRLQADHAALKESLPTEVTHLRECGASLAEHLRKNAAHHVVDVAQAAEHARLRDVERTQQTHVPGVMKVREQGAALQQQIRESQWHCSRRARVLQEQLVALRSRYESIEEQRGREMAALHEDVHSLQAAFTDCERLAARCVAADFVPEGLTLGPGGGGGAAPPPRRGCCMPASKLEALSLRPLVARLRDFLDRCEEALVEARGRQEELSGDSGVAAASACARAWSGVVASATRGTADITPGRAAMLDSAGGFNAAADESAVGSGMAP